MKIKKIAAAAAAVSILPVLFCSCGTSSGKEAAGGQEEAAVPRQETAVQETPQPVEVKADAKTEAALAEQDAQKIPEPAATVKAEKPVSVPAEKAEKKSVPPCEHTVRTGDNLWKIARRYYGTGSQWKRIYEANPGKIKKADLLEPGTVLSIPAFK